MTNYYRRARESVGMTIQEAATALKVSITTLGNWELEKTQPRSTDVIAMARLYKRSTDELLGQTTFTE